MEKETFDLYDRVAALEAENAKLLEWPYLSKTSRFPNNPFDLYEDWIQAEARLDVLYELHVAGFVSAVDFECASKAREARIACGYDSATHRLGEEDGGDEDTIDLVEAKSWYDSIYPLIKDGDGARGRNVKVNGGQSGDAIKDRVGEGTNGHNGDDQ